MTGPGVGSFARSGPEERRTIARSEDVSRGRSLWLDLAGRPNAGSTPPATSSGRVPERVRTGPYVMLAGLLSGLECHVREVRIERLVGSTYYAVVAAEREGSVASIDARPSDALNLAVLIGSPVLVAADVVVGSEAGRQGTPIYARLNQHLRDGTAASAAAVASEAREHWEKSLAESSRHEEPT